MTTDQCPPGDLLREAAERRFAIYLHELRQKVPNPGQRLERDLKAMVRPFVIDASAADYLGFMVMVALVQDTGINRLAPQYNEIVPAANTGRKFTTGRKKGTVGKVRAWVQKYMLKYPNAKPAQAWEAFKKRPPKGCSVYENRLGKYIETEGAPDTSRAWFGTIVGQERPKKLT